MEPFPAPSENRYCIARQSDATGCKQLVCAQAPLMEEAGQYDMIPVG